MPKTPVTLTLGDSVLAVDRHPDTGEYTYALGEAGSGRGIGQGRLDPVELGQLRQLLELEQVDQ